MTDKISGRILFISVILRFLERYFFDPKLKKSLVLALEESKVTQSHSAANEVVCFDIGANRGQTIRLFKEVIPNCKIYAFEPHPDIFKTLVSSYKFEKSVTCFNLAIGELSGKFPFWVSPLDESSSMHLPEPDSTWNRKKALILGIDPKKMYKKIDVDVVTLDDFTLLHGIQLIDILKIDVEGGELQVLLGSRSVFQEDRVSIVQYESHNDDLRPSQQIQIETFLIEYGFVEFSSIKHAFGDFSDKIYIKKR